ncbi:MAG: thioredoxin [Proteobacteria bacterium]|nr:thioredoxin [Cystobacterineae bacterium]MCL2258299.1 thioredoxin [Cystobacterineae bacterium]MCL2315073.1 thioredoxin [Pseudomonadota bacterium]
MSFAKEISDSEFQNHVLESPLPVLVDFWAPWCGPCRAVAPIVEEIAKEYAERLRVAKLNVDECTQTAQQYAVRSIPTLLLFKGGNVVEQIIGSVPKTKLEELLQKVL